MTRTAIALDIMSTKVHMFRVLDVVESATFKRWIHGFRDPRAIAQINARLRHLSLGNLVDVKPVRGGLHERAPAWPVAADCGTATPRGRPCSPG